MTKKTSSDNFSLPLILFTFPCLINEFIWKMEQIVTLTTALKLAHVQNNRKKQGFYVPNLCLRNLQEELENDLLFPP